MATTEARTFQDLANEVSEGFVETVGMIAKALAELAEGLQVCVSEGADLVVAADREESKRDCIKMWREEVARIETLAAALLVVRPSSNEVYKEIRELLTNGARAFHLLDDAKALTAENLRLFIDERSRNLAQAYAERILPESALKTRELLSSNS